MKHARSARGSVTARNGAWWLRIPETTEQPDGERRLVRRRVRLGTAAEIRTEAEARRRADAWIARRYPERLRNGRQVRFAAAAELFGQDAEALMRASSRKQYAGIRRRHLVPHLGSLWLHELDTAALRSLMARLAGKRLSRASIASIRAVALHIARWARASGFDVGVIEARSVAVPKDDRPPKAPRWLSSRELDLILSASLPPWRALWGVLGLAGLRISEALALTWDDVGGLDGSEPILHVRRSTARGELHPTKTRTSTATLPIAPELAALLREHRATWQGNRLQLLFPALTGRPLLADNVRRRQWHPLLQRLGIPRAGLHAPRHGLAARLLERGVSAEIVRQMLRHADLKITSRYSHASARDVRAAIAAATRSSAHPGTELTQGREQTP